MNFLYISQSFTTSFLHQNISSPYIITVYYFGGYYDPDTDQVWFRISEYVQDLILAGPNAEDYGLYIYTYSGAYNAKRWIFHGPNSPDTANRIKLDIIYSKIDD